MGRTPLSDVLSDMRRLCCASTIDGERRDWCILPDHRRVGSSLRVVAGVFPVLSTAADYAINPTHNSTSQGFCRTVWHAGTGARRDWHAGRCSPLRPSRRSGRRFPADALLESVALSSKEKLNK